MATTAASSAKKSSAPSVSFPGGGIPNINFTPAPNISLATGGTGTATPGGTIIKSPPPFVSSGGGGGTLPPAQPVGFNEEPQPEAKPVRPLTAGETQAVDRAKEAAKTRDYSNLTDVDRFNLAGFGIGSYQGGTPISTAFRQSDAPPVRSAQQQSIADVQGGLSGGGGFTRQEPVLVAEPFPSTGQQIKNIIATQNPFTGLYGFAIERGRGYLASQFEYGGGQNPFAGTTGERLAFGAKIAPFLIPATAPAAASLTGIGALTPGGLKEAKAVGQRVEDTTGIASLGKVATSAYVGVSVVGGLYGTRALVSQTERLVGLPKFRTDFVTENKIVRQEGGFTVVESQAAAYTQQKNLLSTRDFVSALRSNTQIGVDSSGSGFAITASRGVIRENMLLKPTSGKAIRFTSADITKIEAQENINPLIADITVDGTRQLSVTRDLGSGNRFTSISGSVGDFGEAASISKGVSGTLSDGRSFIVASTSPIRIKDGLAVYKNNQLVFTKAGKGESFGIGKQVDDLSRPPTDITLPGILDEPLSDLQQISLKNTRQQSISTAIEGQLRNQAIARQTNNILSVRNPMIVTPPSLSLLSTSPTTSLSSVSNRNMPAFLPQSNIAPTLDVQEFQPLGLSIGFPKSQPSSNLLSLPISVSLQGNIARLGLASGQKTLSKLRINQENILTTSSTQRFNIGQDSLQGQLQRQTQRQTLKQTTIVNILPKNNYRISTRAVIPFALPRFGGGSSSFLRISSRQPKQRTPSFFAASFGITSPKAAMGEMSGIIGRPVIRRASRKRK